MDTNFNKAIKVLEKYNQKEIIPFLENGKNTLLINQILDIDFDNLKKLYDRTIKKETVKLAELKPVSSLNPNKIAKDKLEEIKNIGIDIIKQNKFAVTTMAGGQGTRLRAQ